MTRGKKTKQTEEEVGRHIREWTDLEFGKSKKAVENREKMEKTGCKIICGAPTTPVVKGLMMMMMMMMMMIRTLPRKGFPHSHMVFSPTPKRFYHSM